MTANELANQLKCHVARHGDCKVCCNGRRVDKSYFFDSKQEGRLVSLSLLPVHRKDKSNV